MSKATHKRGDWLALAFQETLKDDSIQRFQKPMQPPMKKEAAVKTVETVDEIYKQVLAYSEEFERLGLVKSAMSALKVAETLVAEVKEDEPAKDWSEIIAAVGKLTKATEIVAKHAPEIIAKQAEGEDSANLADALSNLVKNMKSPQLNINLVDLGPAKAP